MVILALQASVRNDQLYNGMAPGVRRIYFTGVSIWDSATTDISCECKDGYFSSTGQGDCIPWQECDADTQVTDFPGSKTRNRDCKCKVGHSRETQATVLDLTEICDPCDSGEYQDSTGQTSCDPCAAGTYQPNAGQTSCKPAEIGYKVSAEGATSPTACAPLARTKTGKGRARAHRVRINLLPPAPATSGACPGPPVATTL